MNKGHFFSIVGCFYGCALLGRFLESEGKDRADIDLPGNQLQMLHNAAATSSNSKYILAFCLTATITEFYQGMKVYLSILQG